MNAKGSSARVCAGRESASGAGKCLALRAEVLGPVLAVGAAGAVADVLARVAVVIALALHPIPGRAAIEAGVAEVVVAGHVDGVLDRRGIQLAVAHERRDRLVALAAAGARRPAVLVGL